MLVPIVRPREDCSALIQNDLLRIEKPNPLQAVEHFASEHRSMPDVGHLDARHQLERRRPVRARIAGDRGLVVALRSMLHVAASGRAAAIEAGAVAPLGIELDPIWRIGDHQQRLAVAEESRHIIRAGGVSAENAMLAAQPQIASPRHRVRGKRRSLLWLSLVWEQQQIVDLLGVEAGEREVEVRLVQFLQFEGEQFVVPVGPGHRAIHHQPERLDLGLGPLVAEHHGDSSRVAAGPRAQLARGLESEVAVHHVPLLRASTGILKPNSRIAAHMRSTAASFLRGFRAYGMRRSMFQV